MPTALLFTMVPLACRWCVSYPPSHPYNRIRSESTISALSLSPTNLAPQVVENDASKTHLRALLITSDVCHVQRVHQKGDRSRYFLAHWLTRLVLVAQHECIGWPSPRQAVQYSSTRCTRCWSKCMALGLTRQSLFGRQCSARCAASTVLFKAASSGKFLWRDESLGVRVVNQGDFRFGAFGKPF